MVLTISRKLSTNGMSGGLSWPTCPKTKKEAIKAIPEFEERNVLKLPILKFWWIEERENVSVMDSAMEKVKAVLAQE